MLQPLQLYHPMSWVSVPDWLSRITPADVDCACAATTTLVTASTTARNISRKRALVSLPTSTTPTKRQRRFPIIEHEAVDNDHDCDAQDTPRAAKHPGSGHASSVSTSHTRSVYSDQTSNYSNKTGRSSPTKQIARLRINASMQHRMMDDNGSNDFPESLRKLLDPIKRATTLCRGLLFESQRQEIRYYALADPNGRRNFRDCYNDDVLFTSASADQFDPVDPEFVGFILDEARECDENLHPEASWNMQVHYPLMRRAIMGASRRQYIPGGRNPLVTVVPCTTASLVTNFKVPDAPAHKVDFAIALEPIRTAVDGTATEMMTADGTVADRIEACRKSMPGLSINHTDYAPLLHRPIAISVETKRTNDDFEKARVQLMVWLAAQWAKVESMTDHPPEVLPAIIIQGHDWYLVTSTRADDGKKFLWCKHNFGSTGTPLGIYKIVWTLQYLSRWAVDTHWAWFKSACLKLGDQASSLTLP
ncbi:putative methyltransferase type 11 [Rosellinia necatrix]|uniref:Putative methyltransferase type 11 n=1 Tax=Rosellinia necatrix TaxID=77044 RepID=A0A1S8A6P6_ROSNE|nr:putative methyltransferase type 11 [Rosellinia necatrix]